MSYKLVGGALAGLAAAGLISGATPANAAPECADYVYPSVMTLQQDNGLIVNLYHQGSSFDGPGASVHGNGSPQVMGTSSGSRIGDNLIFTIKWDNGFENTYTGKIGADLVARGTTINNKGASNSWFSLSKYRCIPPEPAQQAPPPPPPPPPDEPALPTSTVSGDVDVYAQPGGVGQPVGILRGGQSVEVLERRGDNWVRVSGAGVPGGSGWVWGDFIS
ncbi:hypothetical protein BVC93_22230 [Mycobacterium sp. MS1601]|uniref:SH3 domain-containing protein n=1 Tax=Mycobacterium sp. MS1601 TaxID=1936029 RepID=UPI0009793B2F|nr:SH3 domain-containing protein [Mycobacterium sp. MS1601]AQA04685.1 hypothetical protein BVC93_22230 [Mycobacterium sp. MS1601]